MIIHPVSRRDFLKLAALSLGGLAARTFDEWLDAGGMNFMPVARLVGRATISRVKVYQKPDAHSQYIERLERDALVEIKEEVFSPAGPVHNPRWYRLERGFVHSAYVQRIWEAFLNQPLEQIPESGILGEVTVPYSLSYYTNRKGEWLPLYRLYYSSLHWITGAWQDAAGRMWYQLTDEWLKIAYHAPAGHFRPVAVQEWSPLAAELPDEDKRVVVSLADQTLTAYEGERTVLQTQVATGRRYMETPKGEFQINRKLPSKHMGDGALTSRLDAFELPGVPWACFFHTNGVAFHGAYWHDNFGTPMSQGCVNMRVADALWLFRWCTPAYPAAIASRKDWAIKGKGTLVQVY